MKPERDLASGNDLPRLRKEDSLPGAGRFGLRLILVALGIPFVATLIAVAHTVWQNSDRGLVVDWGGIPAWCWVSTIFAALTSLSAHRAVVEIRRDENRLAYLWGGMTIALAIAFLVAQALSCFEVMGGALAEDSLSRAYRAIVYLLTVYHWFHVAGAVGFQLHVNRQVRENRYFSSYHPGVALIAEAWHFIDVTWIALLVGLLLLLP